MAVIDGSTSKTPLRINRSMSNGRYCMELIRQHIASIPPDTDVRSFCNGVTGRIRAAGAAAGADMERLTRCPVERPAASAAIYSARLRQLWLIGDCQCLVDGRLFDNPKPQEAHLASLRAEYLRTALNARRLTAGDVINGADPGREHIISRLIDCCKWQNVRYSVIDGFPIPIEHVRVISLSDSVREVVLASDGYPFLCPTLRESEEKLAAQLSRDPLCINTYKATKGLKRGNLSFDDRCYIRFRPFS